MNYSDKTLLALDQVKKLDKNIVACFAFGSFVTEETSSKSYREIRLFDGDAFMMSKFNLTNIYPDIDVLCVSKDNKKTAAIFNKNIKEVFGHYVTINVVSPEVFERELFSDQPSALKRILLYRKLLVVKGDEYIQKLKKEVEKIEAPSDSIFQNEYNFRKEYLKLFSRYNVSTIIFTANDYERLFPNMYKFIIGDLYAGFPADRIKLVYPKAMDLKSEVDISKLESSQII